MKFNQCTNHEVIRWRLIKSKKREKRELEKMVPLIRHSGETKKIFGPKRTIAVQPRDWKMVAIKYSYLHGEVIVLQRKSFFNTRRLQFIIHLHTTHDDSGVVGWRKSNCQRALVRKRRRWSRRCLYIMFDLFGIHLFTSRGTKKRQETNRRRYNTINDDNYKRENRG